MFDKFFSKSSSLFCFFHKNPFHFYCFFIIKFISSACHSIIFIISCNYIVYRIQTIIFFIFISLKYSSYDFIKTFVQLFTKLYKVLISTICFYKIILCKYFSCCPIANWQFSKWSCFINRILSTLPPYQNILYKYNFAIRFLLYLANFNLSSILFLFFLQKLHYHLTDKIRSFYKK